LREDDYLLRIHQSHLHAVRSTARGRGSSFQDGVIDVIGIIGKGP
jgi:hypothetical protein